MKNENAIMDRIKARIAYHANEHRHTYEIGKGVMDFLARDLLADFKAAGGLLPPVTLLSRGARLLNSSRSTSPKASASRSSEAYRHDPGKITTAANTRPSKSSPILSILRTPKRKAPPEATPKAP